MQALLNSRLDHSVAGSSGVAGERGSHPSVQTLLRSGCLVLLFFPARPPHLCFTPFQSLPSELTLTPVPLPQVLHQSPPPTKHSVPSHLVCCLTRNSPRPCSAPLCSFPSSPDPLLRDVHISAHIKERDDVLPTTTRRTFNQQPKPSCSSTSPHHFTAGQPLQPAHSLCGRFPGLISS